MKFVFGTIEFDATSKFIKEVHGFPFEKNDMYKGYHNEFKITISRDGIERSFNFYGSNADWQNGMKSLNCNGLKRAVEAIICDGYCEHETFEEFCSEFGYDTDSRQAEQTYKAILKSVKKLKELGFTQDELMIINETFNS